MATGGVVSHVVPRGPAVLLDEPPPPDATVTYDDGSRLLLIAAGSRLYAYSPSDPEAGPRVAFVREGPVISARYSPDGRILGMQRSATEVEFVNTEDAAEFTQHVKRGSGERLLGFFFAAGVPGIDVVLVTSGGLELHALTPERNGLRLVEEKRRGPVLWYAYTHETRLVLLASGSQANRFAGFQFAPGGALKIPKVEMPLAQATSGGPKPVLSPRDVQLLAMYGGLYLAHVDRTAGQLRLYRFFRDALVKERSFTLYSPAVALSVVDNALLVHAVDSTVTVLLDVGASSTHPVASPLPLGVPDAATPDGALTFLSPDIVLDRSAGLVWQLQLDLKAIVESSSDRASLAGFLQRRRQPEGARLRSGGPRALTLALVRSMLLDMEPLADLRQVFGVLARAYADASAPSGSAAATAARIASPTPTGSGRQATGAAASCRPLASASPAATPDEVAAVLFEPIVKGEVGPIDPLYLQAVMVECMRALDNARLTPPPRLAQLLAAVLDEAGEAHALVRWATALLPHPGEPNADAGAEAVAKAVSPASPTLAAEVMRRGNAHTATVRALLAEGKLLPALRVMRRHRVQDVEPAELMEAAGVRGDPVEYAAVLQFCMELVPHFSEAPEFEAYAAPLWPAAAGP